MVAISHGSRAQGDASPVEIFHVEMGDPRAPVLLLIHGWPTSSIDWFEVADQLSGRFRVCALDFPGYGFSDKPQGWGYSLPRDEELIEFYLPEIIGAEAAVVVAHDRGDSVALVHAARCAEGRSATRLEHLVLSNGNIFLPLSNLTQEQRQALDAQSWSQVVAAVTPSMLAEGMGATTFTPPRSPVIQVSHGILNKGLRISTVSGKEKRCYGWRSVPGTRGAAPGGELRVEPVPDVQARRQPPVLHPGRESLPAGRPAGRIRESPPARARTPWRPGTRRPRGGTGRSPTGRYLSRTAAGRCRCTPRLGSPSYELRT